MPEKTIRSLNEKIWYRLAKVIFLLCFAITAFITVFITFDTKKTRVITDYAVSTLIVKITIGEDDGKKIFDFNDFGNEIKIETTETEDTLGAIKYSILNFVIVVLIFEVIRRMFFYIVLGKLFPKKSQPQEH
jgi:hypothetical protein